MFVTGLVLLTIGAAVAGAGQVPAVLLTGRVLQGLGAAMAYPSCLALLGESFPDEPWRSRAFAGSSVTGATATVTGVVFGGFVTGWLGWPWVFWLTVPAGLLLLALGLRVLPADRTRRRSGRRSGRRSLDVPGAVLATATVVAVVTTVIQVGETRRLDVLAVGAVVSAVLLAALVARERAAADPLLAGAVLGSRQVRGGCAGMAGDSALYSAITFTTALLLHDRLGMAAATAGLAMVPVSLGIVGFGTLLGPRLRRRYGSVRLVLGGLVLGAGAAGWLAATPADPSYGTHLLAPLLLVGAALSAITMGSQERVLGRGDEAHRGVASSVLETSTHVGGAVAVACYAGVLAATDGDYGAAYVAAAAFAVAALVAVAFSAGRPTTPRRRSRPRSRAGRERSVPAGAAAGGTSARASTPRRPPR